MERYENFDGDSGVVFYEIGQDFLKVKFKSGPIYVYTTKSVGVDNLAKMKRLATSGRGLNEFINKNVRKDYEFTE